MQVTITGRKVHLRDDFKELVDKKLSKFDRIFGEDAVAEVTVTVEKWEQRVEITIRHKGKVYRAESNAQDMYESLDNALNAIGRQMRKNKSKLDRQLRTGLLEHYAYDDFDEAENRYEIVRSKKFIVKPLTAEEAIVEMNLIGHQFYMFRNVDDNEINVVYKRKDGKYGLLQPE